MRIQAGGGGGGGSSSPPSSLGDIPRASLYGTTAALQAGPYSDDIPIGSLITGGASWITWDNISSTAVLTESGLYLVSGGSWSDPPPDSAVDVITAQFEWGTGLGPDSWQPVILAPTPANGGQLNGIYPVAKGHTEKIGVYLVVPAGVTGRQYQYRLTILRLGDWL